MKRILILISILVITALCASCGNTANTGGGPGDNVGKGTQYGSSQQSKPDDSNKGQPAADNTTSQSEAVDAYGIPQGYPQDIVPLYKMGTVAEAYGENGEYRIAFLSKAPMNEAAKFYKDLFDKAENKKISEDQSRVEVTGTLKGKNFMVGLVSNSSDPQNCSIVILLVH